MEKVQAAAGVAGAQLAAVGAESELDKLGVLGQGQQGAGLAARGPVPKFQQAVAPAAGQGAVIGRVVHGEEEILMATQSVA